MHKIPQMPSTMSECERRELPASPIDKSYGLLLNVTHHRIYIQISLYTGYK
jgi:hypothetical protein